MRIDNAYRPKTDRGFTLVELMVVVLVVGILTAIAVPGYRTHVVKTQRSAAKACLMQYSALMERYYTTELTYDYVTRTGDTDPVPPGCSSENSLSQHYTFSVTGLSATGYTVNATKTAAFAPRDKQCGNLSLDQRGQKAVSTGVLATCWN